MRRWLGTANNQILLGASSGVGINTNSAYTNALRVAGNVDAGGFSILGVPISSGSSALNYTNNGVIFQFTPAGQLLASNTVTHSYTLWGTNMHPITVDEWGNTEKFSTNNWSVTFSNTTPVSVLSLSNGILSLNGISFLTNLPPTGTAGTYIKTTFDAQGRETSGTTLAIGDLPAGYNNGGNANFSTNSLHSTNSDFSGVATNDSNNRLISSLPSTSTVIQIMTTNNASSATVATLDSNGSFISSSSFDQKQSEPVPPFTIGTYYISTNANQPYESDVTNAIWLYKTNGVLAALKSYGAAVRMNISYNWQSNVRDTNGNITWSTNNFPDGMPYIANFCHTNGFQVMLFVNNLPISSGFSSYTNLFADLTNILSWGVDALDTEGTGTGVGEGLLPSGQTAWWNFTTNQNYNKKILSIAQRAIEYMRQPVSGLSEQTGAWTNPFTSYLGSPTPIGLRFGSEWPWTFETVENGANEWYVNQFGSQDAIAGDYNTFADSVAANLSFESIVDTVETNYETKLHAGSYPIVGSAWVNQDSHYLTNILTAMSMMDFLADFNAFNAGSLNQAMLKNQNWISIYDDKLVQPSILFTNIPAGDNVLQVRTKMMVNNTYAVWLWNRSTNTTVIPNLNLSAMLGVSGDFAFQDAATATRTINSTNNIFSVSCPAFSMQLFLVKTALPIGTGGTNIVNLLNGLNIWWPLNEGAGLTANDFSRNGSVGTASSAAIWTNLNQFGNVVMPANAYYITVASNAFNSNLSNGMTASIWFNCTNTVSNGCLFSAGTGSNPGDFVVYEGSSTTLNYYIQTTNSATGSTATVPIYTDGKWHNVLIEYDGSSLASMFFDGVQVNTYARTGTLGNDSNASFALQVGARQAAINFNYGNELDFRLWNRPLSPIEINWNYLNGQPVANVAANAQVPASSIVGFPSGLVTNNAATAITVTNGSAATIISSNSVTTGTLTGSLNAANITGLSTNPITAVNIVWVDGGTWTNTLPVTVLISAGATWSTPVIAVTGQAGETERITGTYPNTNFLGIGTTTASISMPYTNYFPTLAVSSGGTVTFTNASTGTGNTASVLPNGQYSYVNQLVAAANASAIYFTNGFASSNPAYTNSFSSGFGALRTYVQLVCTNADAITGYAPGDIVPADHILAYGAANNSGSYLLSYLRGNKTSVVTYQGSLTPWNISQFGFISPNGANAMPSSYTNFQIVTCVVNSP